MAAYQTIYKDPTGNQKTGYIINGTTYQDQGGVTPVEVGSTVTDVNGRQWYKGADGSVEIKPGAAAPAQTTQTDPGLSTADAVIAQWQSQQQQAAARQEELLRKQQEQQDALIKAKTDAAVQRLQAQVDPLNQGYDAQKKQNYRNFVEGGQSLGQQLEAAGLSTSGAAESSRVRMAADYNEGQNTVEMARQNALADLRTQIEQARMSGDYAAAEQMSAYYQQLAAMTANQAESQGNALLQSYQLKQDEEARAYEREQAALQWARQLERDQIGDRRYEDETAYERAQAGTKASSGGAGTVKSYGGLGSYVQTLLGLWQADPTRDLNGDLTVALQNGLISQQDYVAALQVAGGTRQQEGTPAAAPAAGGKSYYVEGMGTISEAEADRLLQNGSIYVVSTDRNGDPTFALSAAMRRGTGQRTALTQ